MPIAVFACFVFGFVFCCTYIPIGDLLLVLLLRPIGEKKKKKNFTWLASRL